MKSAASAYSALVGADRVVPGASSKPRNSLANHSQDNQPTDATVNGSPVRILTAILVAAVAGLFGLSIHLARTRIYQVDEYQNLYMAMVLAKGKAAEFFTNGAFFMLGPLSWLTRNCEHAGTIVTSARFLFLGVFWLNILLLAKIAGGRLRSTKGVIALAAAATLAPLWDYGFEVRHDNLILTGILFVWWMIRSRSAQLYSYALVGAITFVSLFVAVKSIVYVFPLSFALLLAPPSAYVLPQIGFFRSRLKLGLIWLAGAIVGLIFIRLCYGSSGGFDVYLSAFNGVAKYSAGKVQGSTRFLPWFALNRLLTQTPLLLALTLAGCLAMAVEFKRKGKAAANWGGCLPEVILAGGALVAMFANPTPFPYNLVHFVPYMFLLAFKYADMLWNEQLKSRAAYLPLIFGVVLCVHIFPFGRATLRHLDHSNARQKTLTELAETFTDPAKDPVYDAIGMVPTRWSIHYQWYLHSLNIQTFTSDAGLKFRDMLQQRPAAVFVPSYRTDWLGKKDHDYIKSHYLPLADDFWLLGQSLPAGGGDLEILHAGRYAIYCDPNNSTNLVELANYATASRDGAAAVTLDGNLIAGNIIQLSAGRHHLDAGANRYATVVWLGPKLNSLPQLSAGSHLELFSNWY